MGVSYGPRRLLTPAQSRRGSTWNANRLCLALAPLLWIAVAAAQEGSPTGSAIRDEQARDGSASVRNAQDRQAPDAPAADEAAIDLDETVVYATEGEKPHWVDSSHQFASNRTQAMVQWMDDFFGAEVRDAERADTFLRTIIIDSWDQRDGHDFAFRVRGQVSLPKISERVDLIFSGEEAEQTLTEEERAQENDVGIRFNFRDDRRTRVDATLSLRTGPAVLPGVRLRYQLPLSGNSWGRATQRLQYHSSDGFRSLTNIDLNRTLSDRSLLRWGARMRYREDREFWDWNTGITYRRWMDDHDDFPSAVELFATMSGRDDPEPFETNYRLGFLYRKQFFREFLFFELEPSYNWRRDTYEEEREGVMQIVLRLEIMLDDDLVARRRNR